MILNKVVSTNANTDKNNPHKTSWKITKGLIYQVDFYFPPGPSGLVGVKILEGSLTLYPLGGSDYLIGDNIKYSFSDLHNFNIETNLLDIYTYNIDEAYEHLIQITIGVVSEQTYVAFYDTEERIKMANDAVKASRELEESQRDIARREAGTFLENI